MDGTTPVDWTSVWLFVLSCALCMAGWWVRRVDRKLDALDADLTSMKIAGSGGAERSTAADARLDRIERKIDRLDEKLDSKADRATCVAIHGPHAHRGADD